MKAKMGLESLLQSAFPVQTEVNSTDPSIAPGLSITTLLETFVPGYGPIHKFLLVTFGFDVTVLVSFAVALWLGARIFRSAKSIILNFIDDHYMSEIDISSEDEIHTHIIAFLAHKYKVKSARRLMAETLSMSAWERDTQDKETSEATVDAEGNIIWLNFSNQDAKNPPRFTPALGAHNFWHNGTYFWLSRKEAPMWEGMGGVRDKERLTLSCIGRSTNPIKAFIEHAKEHHHKGHNAKTVIKRPASKERRRYGGSWAWTKVAERPCRPMQTVVLDEEKKLDVMSDINEYLNPATARW